MSGKQRAEREFMFEKEVVSEEKNSGHKQEQYVSWIVVASRKKLLAEHAAQPEGFLPKVGF